MRAYGVENYKGKVGHRKNRVGWVRGWRTRICPCCISYKVLCHSKSLKKKARQISKSIIKTCIRPDWSIGTIQEIAEGMVPPYRDTYFRAVKI